MIDGKKWTEAKKLKTLFGDFEMDSSSFLALAGKGFVSFRFDLKCPQNKFWNTGDTGSEAFNVCLQV